MSAMISSVVHVQRRRCVMHVRDVCACQNYLAASDKVPFTCLPVCCLVSHQSWNGHVILPKESLHHTTSTNSNAERGT